MGASSLSSLDAMIANTQSWGPVCRLLGAAIATTTAANITSGYISGQRMPRRITVPSVGAGVSGYYVTAFNACSGSSGYTYVLALEYSLGTLTVSGNVFADGVAMPTKTVRGLSLQTATVLPVLVVTTGSPLSATTPTVTITYTDQDGNGGATAALTLPSNPVLNSVFCVAPHLASGDTGIRDVTNMSIDTGTSGVLTLFGLLVLAQSQQQVLGLPCPLQPIMSPEPQFLSEAGETWSIYRFGASGTSDIFASIYAVPETI